MALPRFPNLNEEELGRIMDSTMSENTKKVVNNACMVMKSYCGEIGVKFDDLTGSDVSDTNLNDVLRKFYAASRNKDGDLYRKKTMLSIRYGLQKHFLKNRKVDIVNNDTFKEANDMFHAVLKKLKAEGKGKTDHKEPINKEDLLKLYNYLETVHDTPSGLQNKVFIDFMLYFCNRGRENLRDLKKGDFEFCGEGENRFIKLKDMKTKNHKGDMADNKDSQGGRIISLPRQGKQCPLKSFIRYFSLLNPGNDYFWQRPKSKVNDDDLVWYDNSVVGKNTLGDKMKCLSSVALLSMTYTNHCIRATTVTLLDQNGFESRDIMAVTGHTSANSIAAYTRTNEAQKRRMAEVIGSALTENDQSHTENISKEKKLKMMPQKDQNSDQAPTAEPLVSYNQADKENLDFLELTDSQEKQLLEEFGLEESTPTPSQTVTFNRQNNQIMTRVAPQPIFNFINIGTISIHYHM